MGGNTFGNIFRLSTFGESHGVAIGGVIDGCPAGLHIDIDFVLKDMLRRKPGQSQITTWRSEDDSVEFLSGIFDGKSTGAPIGFIIHNKDQRPEDYEKLEKAYRPSHADFVYDQKYGVRDHRGGGRSSARETACRVAAGAIAKLILQKNNIAVSAFVKQIGAHRCEKNFDELDFAKTDTNLVRCPDENVAAKMIAEIEKAAAEGDSLGGIIQCVITNVPAGLGEPVFQKLNAALGHAMLGINAVKGFEIGSGFSGVGLRGSQHNDLFEIIGGKAVTKTNNSGGIQGGISNGMPVFFNVAFKPTASISKSQKTITSTGKETELQISGRHDPCVLPRAVPIVEAMAALVIADHLLMSRCNRL